MIAERTLGTPDTGFRLTGPKVLAIIVAFFATIATVDGIMIHFALSTFSGQVTEHPYESGVAYNKAIAAARAQDDLHWSVTTHVVRTDGIARIEVQARDATGAALSDLDMVARFESPSDTKLDHQIPLMAKTPGLYVGQLPLAASRWDVILHANRQGKLIFQSTSRIIID